MQLPAQIGKYELLEFLGGGMSHVYRARDTVLGRTVAVKILTENGAADPEAKARFLLEARMAGNIQHDNVMGIHDYGEEQGRPFIVMEFLVGEDLRSAIKKEHTGDLANRLKIALQIARALEYVHSKRIIHRDIKPENIHLDASGRAKLMDFGIAKAEGLSITKAGFALGTPYYMAPEQVLGKPVTEAVDVYAFGILFFELLTGIKPITGETVERLFYMILHEPLNLQPLHVANIPKPVIDLIARCTAKNVEERIPNCTIVCSELEALMANQQRPGSAVIAPPPPAKSAGVSGRVVAIGIAAVVLVVVAAAFYLVLSKRRVLDPVLATETGEMILVLGGEFLAGEGRNPTTLPPFYIDKTEVTNAMYARFCQAKGRPLPPGFMADRPNDPVVNITIVDAQEFAKWAGKRLPTALEWEKAARGTDGRPFPWGEESDASRANVSDNPQIASRGLVAVDTMTAGASPFGLLHMAGNVWEFVDELRTPSQLALEAFAQALDPAPTVEEPWYMVKGGSFDRPLAYAKAYEFIAVPARFAAVNIGFRCAKNVD
ncbi:MAG: serine/threonine protein kinase [Bryobacteraceae bacterium]